MIYFIGDAPLFHSDVYTLYTNYASTDSALPFFTVIGVDIETEGFSRIDNMLSIQVGNYEQQFVIDSKYAHPTKILEDPSVIKVFWNANFDLKWLDKVSNIYDAMLAEIVLTNGLNVSYTLEAAVLKYCGVKLDKTIRGAIVKEGFTDRVIKYAAEDVKYLLKIREAQLEKAKELGLEKVIQLENEAVQGIVSAELKGIKLDTEKLGRLKQELKEELSTTSNRLDELAKKYPVKKRIQLNLFGYKEREIDINYSSPVQVYKLLRMAGLNLRNTLERSLLKYQRNPLVYNILEYRKLSKLLTGFIEKLPDHIAEDKRIHPSYWQIVNSGRMSCSKPNMQNIPARSERGKKIRACFIPEEGYSFVGADYTSLELRLIAEGSQDPLWLQAFRNNEDLHGLIACSLFNINMEQLKDYTPFKRDMTYREVTKTINYMLSYGGGSDKLSDMLSISKEKAIKLIHDYFAIVPKVKAFLDAIGSYGVTHGYIKTFAPYRRIRWFPEWQKNMEFRILSEIDRASRNHPMQGTNGDIIKRAIHLLYERIADFPCNLILFIHDEILTECRDDCAEEWRKVLCELMVEAGQEVIKSLPVMVDSYIVKEWKK